MDTMSDHTTTPGTGRVTGPEAGVEAALRAGPPGHDRRAHDAFLAAAVAGGDAAVVFDLVASPVGDLLVALTPHGLVRLAFVDGRDAAVVLDELARRLSPRLLRAPSSVAPVRRQLEEYFAGRRRHFDVPVDWSLTSPFTQAVLDTATRIPYGRVHSYGQVAADVGKPRAARAVGRALGANPVPVVVPCHRVVRTGGHLGGYTGGLDVKRLLLDLEGAAPRLGGAPS